MRNNLLFVVVICVVLGHIYGYVRPYRPVAMSEVSATTLTNDALSGADNHWPILFRSYCTQKFCLDKRIDDEESQSIIVELKEDGAVIREDTESTALKHKLRGKWALGSNNDIHMVLESTFRGKFTEYTSRSILVGRPAWVAQSNELVVSGEIRDDENPQKVVGSFSLIPCHTEARVRRDGKDLFCVV